MSQAPAPAMTTQPQPGFQTQPGTTVIMQGPNRSYCPQHGQVTAKEEKKMGAGAWIACIICWCTICCDCFRDKVYRCPHCDTILEVEKAL